jgi:antitoxin ParD1/3/4
LIRDREAQLAALDAAGESEAGRGKLAEEVFDRLDAKYRAMAGEAK